MSHRKRIARFGIRPHTVSVFSESKPSGRYCRAAWRVDGRLRTRSWPDDAAGRREAKAFAETLSVELRAPVKAAAPLTLAELWAKYVEAEWDALRPKTRTNYSRHWRSWEIYASAEIEAKAVTRETLDGFRTRLRALGIAISQIRKHVELVKRVYRFGVDRELIPPTRILDYAIKAGKDEKRPDTVEYRTEDADKIIAALNPKDARQWRAWAFCVFARYTGARANAILHLQWNDIIGDTIVWRARWDKTGKERRQPMTRQVLEAHRVAWERAQHSGYGGPWVFFSPKEKTFGQPITYGGINWMLRQAEARAGVPHVRMNAAHRFRRGVVGDVIDATAGDVRLAMAWIGDDVREATKYVKDRDDRLQGVAELLNKRGE